MVVFLLCVKADLENVEEITPEEHLRYCLDVRRVARAIRNPSATTKRLRHSSLRACVPAQLKQSDGDEERKGVYVSDEEEHELPGGSKVRPACRCRRETRLGMCRRAVWPRGELTRGGVARRTQGIAHFVFSWPDVKRQARPARGLACHGTRCAALRSRRRPRRAVPHHGDADPQGTHLARRASRSPRRTALRRSRHDVGDTGNHCGRLWQVCAHHRL